MQCIEFCLLSTTVQYIPTSPRLALTLLAGWLSPAFREAASKRPSEAGLPPSLAPVPTVVVVRSSKTVR